MSFTRTFDAGANKVNVDTGIMYKLGCHLTADPPLEVSACGFSY